MHHATAGSLLGIPGVAWFWVLTVLGVGAVVISLGRRFELLRLGRADARFDRIGERIRHVAVYAFGQRKMFDDLFAGVYHLLIFFGFLVVSLRTITMVFEGLFVGLGAAPVAHAGRPRLPLYQGHLRASGPDRVVGCGVAARHRAQAAALINCRLYSRIQFTIAFTKRHEAVVNIYQFRFAFPSDLSRHS